MQHHCYAIQGTDPAKFVEIGVKSTFEETDLEYFVHKHGYDMYGVNDCNAECKVIRSGTVERVVPVTQTDAAIVQAEG